MKIHCWTYFDITATGVKYNFNTGRLPFTANNGVVINDQQQWEFARNQQRNWETVVQLISLRVLPQDITVPELIINKRKKQWHFDFTVEDATPLSHGLEDLGALLQDTQGVPMLVGLLESEKIKATLEPSNNIEFQITEW